MGRPTIPIVLSPAQWEGLLKLEREFDQSSQKRWADRCRAIRMRSEGQSAVQVARSLGRPLSTVQDRTQLWRREGLEGMSPRTYLTGRKPKLTPDQFRALKESLAAPPKGVKKKIWTSSMVADYVRERWGVEYCPASARRILQRLRTDERYGGIRPR